MRCEMYMAAMALLRTPARIDTGALRAAGTAGGPTGPAGTPCRPLELYGDYPRLVDGQRARSRQGEAVVPDGELDDALAVVSARSLRHGAGAWDRARISSTPLELYVARPVELWLNPGLGTDERERVPDA